MYKSNSQAFRVCVQSQELRRIWRDKQKEWENDFTRPVLACVFRALRYIIYPRSCIVNCPDRWIHVSAVPQHYYYYPRTGFFIARTCTRELCVTFFCSMKHARRLDYFITPHFCFGIQSSLLDDVILCVIFMINV
jgi:hypothetical protein